MPKQKTHRGSAKRFKRTGNGGLKRWSALQAIDSTEKRRNKDVNCVKLQWLAHLI